MRHIPLRALADPQAPDPANVIRWNDVIRQCIRRPLDPQRGVDVEEMRKGIRVLDALDRAEAETLAGDDPETLDLEDADWDHLVAKVKAMQWAVVDRRILLFIGDVLNANDGLVGSPNGLTDRLLDETPAR